MNDIRDHDEERENRVKKILKDLPGVKAAPGFETRLQRRIARGAVTGGKISFWEKIFGARYLPAYAYSLIAIVAVGVLSYYVFLRTGIAPPPPQQIPSGGMRDERAPQKMEGKKGVAGEEKKQKVMEEAEPSSDVKVESSIHENRAQPPQRTNEADQQSKPAPAQQKPAAPVLQEEIRPQESVQSRTASGAGLKKESQSLPLQERSLQFRDTRSAASNTQQTMVGQFDSAALKDSLRLDSIRQTQKKLQLQQQKVKTRKRIERE